MKQRVNDSPCYELSTSARGNKIKELRHKPSCMNAAQRAIRTAFNRAILAPKRRCVTHQVASTVTTNNSTTSADTPACVPGIPSLKAAATNAYSPQDLEGINAYIGYPWTKD